MPDLKKKKTAEELGAEMKEISISEFFEKNKHLLGFDNPTKALLMAVKEAVDNSLDACQEADMLPDISVKIKEIGEDKYRVTILDNGPGIVKEQIPKVFGKLLYGSKFHHLKQGRGQQGIGISAVVLYSQLTTGEPTRVWSKTEKDKKTHYYELFINTNKNEPEIVKEETVEDGFEHGVKVEMDMTGRYRKWVEDYLKQTSVSNPFAKIAYSAPDGTKMTFPRSFNELPKPPKEMRPHPYGVEFGILQRMINLTQSRTVASFLTNEFSSVGAQTAKEMCKLAKLDPETKPKDLAREQVEKLLNAMQKVKVQRPPTDCLSPIGNDALEKSLKKEFPGAEFIAVRQRDPEVYRGFPFLIETAIVWGQNIFAEEKEKENTIKLIRLANRVPLLYQAGACATVEGTKEVDWKRYGLQQSPNSLPVGPAILVIHMCSVWVPFVSESKEAIAPYPEIVKEMKLAIQDIGRDLSRYLSGIRKKGEAKRRLLIFERYATEVAEALSKLTKKPKKDIETALKSMIGEKVKVTEEGELEGSLEGIRETRTETEEKKAESKVKETKAEKKKSKEGSEVDDE